MTVNDLDSSTSLLKSISIINIIVNLQSSNLKTIDIKSIFDMFLDNNCCILQ